MQSRDRRIEYLQDHQGVLETAGRRESHESDLLIEVSDVASKLGTGRRYTIKARLFWTRVFACSPQCFSMLSQMIHGPSSSTIHAWMKDIKAELKAEITNIDKVAQIAQRWLTKYATKDVMFTLSYDACKVDESISVNEKGHVKGLVNPVQLQHDPRQYKLDPTLFQSLWEEQIAQKNLITHVFVFMLNPISTERGYPIHVVFTNTGSATPQVLSCIQTIPEILSRSGIRILFEASDSDTKYRMFFNKQFLWIYGQYGRIYERNKMNEMNGLAILSVPSVSRCNDIPHILKRWRSRLINNRSLYLRYEDEVSGESKTKTVSADELRALNPGIPLSAFRSGSLPAMDDAYPAMIFTAETLKKAVERDRLDFVVYLLPAVCGLVVLRCKKIERRRRLEIAYLGWSICVYYYSYLESLSRAGKKFEHAILTKELLVDLGNALFCHMYGLHIVTNTYSTAKISSMISEHFFARLRRVMGADQSAGNLLDALLRLLVVDWETPKGEWEGESIPRRCFDAAVCEEGSCYLPNTSAIEVRDFCTTLFRLAGVCLGPTADHYSVFMMARDVNLRNSPAIQWVLRADMVAKELCKFTVHAGQMRLPRIYGRSIKSRFATAAKAESQASDGFKFEEVSGDARSPPV